MSTLSLMAMFRDESWIMNEWITHYLNEGVSKFILIDNNSTDNWQSKINPKYLSSPDIKFVDFKGKQTGKQMQIYAQLLKSHKFETDWLMICDFDEFIYARQEFKTIPQYLQTLPPDVTQVKIPWKMFGSSGHVEQPSSVIKGFTYQDINISNQRIGKVTHVKSIVRCEAIRELNLHAHVTGYGRSILTNGHACKPAKNCEPWVYPYDHRNDALACNHYFTQSEQYFREIQQHRRGGNNNDLVKDLEWFNKHKDKTTFDDELATKTYD